jgi:polyisoprenoid-binding protein YceI
MRSLLVVLAALAASPTAAAATWQADAAAGRLEFTATQAGAKFTGRFGEFAVRLALDPARPEDGALDVTVDVASVDTQDAERDEILRSRDLFWTEEHPRASFRADTIERDGAGWRARGQLTIRGVTKPAEVRFTMTPGAAPVMKGTAAMRRLAFGVGQGDFASTEWIGDEVEVRFELKLRQ